MKNQVCWFRTDLRIDDNSALWKAIENGPTLGIYIATPGQWKLHDDAPVKIDFWKRNLECLEETLSIHNIPLLVFEVDDYSMVPTLILGVCQTLRITALHFNREYPLNEAERDKKVTSLLTSNKISVHAYHDQILFSPDLILNGSGLPYKVFTPFAKKVFSFIKTPINCNNIQIQTHTISISSGLINQKKIANIDWPEVSPELSNLWPCGEKNAHQALIDFCKNRLESYQSLRDIPSVNGTSRLSAYLSAGVISIRRCWNSTSYFCGSESEYIWKKELLWHNFYKYIVYHYPYVCRHLPWRKEAIDIQWREAPNDFEHWCQGETGIPIIDAAMKQLQQTGWMHNRLRMITAMFLSKQLLIDWRWGERWFMQHLVDGDLASNNGGWQWASSTGTDSAPYFRVFNPVRQSQRFDPNGVFILKYFPQLSHLDSKKIHLPGNTVPTYPSPIVDLQLARKRSLQAFKKVY